ncbi:TPA: transglutaminase domain-containing protein [Streptococcus suis]
MDMGYFFRRLSSSDQSSYKKMILSLMERQKSVAISIPEVSCDRLIQSVLLDNPHLFMVNPTLFHYRQSNKTITIYWEYPFNKTEQKQVQHLLNQVTLNINHHLIGLTKYEKVERLYQLFSRNVTYDRNSPFRHSLVGCLIHKKAVCQGISAAFKFMCDHLEIPCLIVEGWSEGEKHSWNIVRINNKNYHIDVTWDLYPEEHEPTYFYFCKSDYDMNFDHGWDKRLYPTCPDNFGTFFAMHNLIFTEESLTEYLIQAIRTGKKICHFQISNPKIFGAVLNKLPAIGNIYYLTDTQLCSYHLRFL